MEKRYVAIDLHLRRSLIVREDEAGNEVGVVRIANDPVALSLALAEAGPKPRGGHRSGLWVDLGRRPAPGRGRDRCTLCAPRACTGATGG